MMRMARDLRHGERREELLVAILAFVLLGWPWLVPVPFGARIAVAALWYVGSLATLVLVIRARQRDARLRVPERPRVSRRKMIIARRESEPTEATPPL